MFVEDYYPMMTPEFHLSLIVEETEVDIELIDGWAEEEFEMLRTAMIRDADAVIMVSNRSECYRCTCRGAEEG